MLALSRHAWIGVVAAYVVLSLAVLLPAADVVWLVVWLLAAALVSAAVTTTAVALVKTRAAMHELDQQCRDLQTQSQVRGVAVQSLHQQLQALAQNKPAPAWPELSEQAGVAENVAACAALLQQVRDVHAGRADAERAALVALARKVQQSAHRIQDVASAMAERHPNDPDVLETSMRVDHEAAQQARQAQTLAVMCGEYAGQQWPKAVPLEDVARAAAGRITAYQRVEVNGDSGLAAKAWIVEPLIHSLAELLANATGYSPPTTKVLVAVRGVARGAIVEIDDGGIGVDEKKLSELVEVASGRHAVDLASLGEVPQTGLRAVGILARQYGLRVDLKYSVYGGLKALLGVPAEQIEVVAPARRVLAGPPTLAPPAPPSLPHAQPSAEAVLAEPAAEAAPEEKQAPSPGLDGLPRRRHRRGEAPAPNSQLRWPPPSTQDSPEEAGAFMRSFLRGSATDHSVEER